MAYLEEGRSNEFDTKHHFLKTTFTKRYKGHDIVEPVLHELLKLHVT